MSVEAAQAAVDTNKSIVSDDVYEPPQALSESTDMDDLEPDEFSVENIERVYRSVASLYDSDLSQANQLKQKTGLAYHPRLLGSLLHVLGHPLQRGPGADDEHIIWA
jgi:hypothetical protein